MKDIYSHILLIFLEVITCYSAMLLLNKKYIGITRQKNILDRWKTNGSGYKNQNKFYNAIQKYGWENFSHEILSENLTEEEACQKEKELIIEFDSITNGYNQQPGGTVVPRYASYENRLRLSLSHMGQKPAFYGKKHKEESKLKMSLRKKKKVFGINLFTDERVEFPSPKDAAEYLGLANSSGIIQCANGTNGIKSTRGYYWFYEGKEPSEEFIRELKENISYHKIYQFKDNKNKIIKAVDINTNEELYFTNAKEAAQYLKKDGKTVPAHIRRYCNYNITMIGYHWSYI